VLASLAELPAAQRADCGQAIGRLPLAFGLPHGHTGLSIRKLADHPLEFRGGLDLRLVVIESAEALRITFLGNHDEVSGTSAPAATGSDGFSCQTRT
jgi:hypothetical protein